MLTEQKIRKLADSSAVYMRGCTYYDNRRVKSLHYFPETHSFAADVLGRECYSVAVGFTPEHVLESYECDCPASFSQHGACKHVVAVLKTIQQNWGKYFSVPGLVPLRQSTKAMLDFFQAEIIGSTIDKAAATAPVKLVPVFHFRGQHSRRISYLEFTVGCDRLYVLKNIPEFITAVDNGQKLTFGKYFTFKPREMVFDELSAALLEMMRQAYAEEQERAGWRQYSFGHLAANSAFDEPRCFKLTNSKLVQFIEIMNGNPFAAVINEQTTPLINIKASRPPVKLAVKTVADGLSLQLDLSGDKLYVLDAGFQYMYHKNIIYQVDSVFADYMQQLLTCFDESRKAEVHIPAAAVSEFVSGALPALETVAAVTVDRAVYKKYHKEELVKRVYLDRAGEGLSARIEFWYGDLAVNPADNTAKQDAQGKWLLRSVREERQLVDLFERYRFSWEQDKFVLPDEAGTFDFLQQALPELQEMAEVFYSEDFNRVRIQAAGRIGAGVRLNADSDMLEFSLQLEDISSRELLDLLAAYRLKKRYYRLPDGAFIPLDSPDLAMTARMIDELGLRPDDIEKQVAVLPKYRALYVDSLARENPEFSFTRSSAFKQMVQDIREPQDIDYAVPQGIQGKLRDYQKTGFKWLKSLANYGMGGILADDMGLGKTLQVIAFVLAEKAVAAGPSLVIAPTSLVYNWQEEVLKFAPTLKTMVISGQPDERQEQVKSIGEVDLVITSYGLIRRDVDCYEEFCFRYCFLDEAQNIKNPNTLGAKAVKQIKAKARFALTGTPIENTLTELWSIFDFIMPGYLRTHKAFSGRFEIPIVKNGDQQALKELGRYIKPFILRRMKKAVLKELPAKVESKLVGEMTGEQAKLYAAWLLRTKAEFEAEVTANGFAKSQIKILSLLTRLRQICCHPSLFIENYQGGSGKLDMLQELLRDAVSGSHRILLFSQFTGMLALIREELANTGIGYFYLDGSTKAEERMSMVNAFNAGENQVFLISLKAGGTGLNLTGADMVIHYDPWWNPAVEDQATDRAYRIGQKNSVQVCKLITKNTIEEKIYLLQQRKKEMIEALIKPGENFLTKMSEAEIRELFS